MMNFKTSALFPIAIFLTTSTAAVAQSLSQPALRLTTAAVPVQIEAGTNAPAKSVLAFNIGSGTLNPVVSTTAAWLSATVGAPASCTASTNGCLPINITFSTAALAAGTYTAYVNVNDPNAIDAPQNIAVTLLVASVPASITAYEPPSGGSYTTTIYGQDLLQTAASTATGGNWLSVSLQGSLGGVFFPYEVTLNSAGLSTAGTYQGSIVVSGSNTASDNKTISVTLNVTTSPIGVLSATQVNLFAGANATTSQTVSIANSGQGTLSVTGATPTTSSGSGWLTATAASNGAVTITANSSGLAPGVYQGSVAVASNAANNAQLVIPVSFLVTSQTGPQISFAGIVDNAIGQSPVSPGDIAVAYGANFTSASPSAASSVPLATTLGGLQVLVNGTAAPLYYSSAGQIDFQVPYGTPNGLSTFQVVNNGVAGNTVSATVAAIQPKILEFLGFSGQPPIIVNFKDGSIATSDTSFTALPAHSASPGDTLIIYAIGLGQTSPAATTGAAANDGSNGTSLQEITSPVSILLGGGFTPSVNLTPAFVGLAPGFVGLYQINFTIPSNAPTGSSVPLMVDMQGAATPTVYIGIE